MAPTLKRFKNAGTCKKHTRKCSHSFCLTFPTKLLCTQPRGGTYHVVRQRTRKKSWVVCEFCSVYVRESMCICKRETWKCVCMCMCVCVCVWERDSESMCVMCPIILEFDLSCLKLIIVLDTIQFNRNNFSLWTSALMALRKPSPLLTWPSIQMKIPFRTPGNVKSHCCCHKGLLVGVNHIILKNCKIAKWLNK